MSRDTSRHGGPNAELNVTPMLDVELVLLIIFIAASIRVHTTVDANLSQRCQGVCEASSQEIVLEILPGARYRINREWVSASALRHRLAEIYANRPDKIIQVAGHPGATYQEVVSAMDVARSAGVQVVGIAPRETYISSDAPPLGGATGTPRQKSPRRRP